MKWKIEKPPFLGQTKNRLKIAFWPTKVGDYIIWLEKYNVVYRYEERMQYDWDGKTSVRRWVEIQRYPN